MTDRERSRSPVSSGDDNGSHENDNGGNDSSPHDGGRSGNGDNGGDAEGVKLYVGNLDYATNEEKLRTEFSQFGEVTDVFLPVERGTSRPRGFGFVTLRTRQAAEEAISKMDQAQLDGRTIRVNESRPTGSPPQSSSGGGGGGGFNAAGNKDVKLYVGNLDFHTTQESVKELFEGIGEVTDCFMPTDRDSGRVLGFCFVTMPAAVAEEACTKLNGQELDGRTLRVNEAQPKGSGGGGGRGGRGGGGRGGRGGGRGGRGGGGRRGGGRYGGGY